MDEAARLARVQGRFALAQAFDKNDDLAMHEDLLMLAGGNNQWDPKAVQDRTRLGRPLYTANRFPSLLAQITGEVRANPPAISCTPADSDATPEAAQVFEGLIRSIERLSQAQQVYSETVELSAGAGKGHMRIVPVYADDESFDVELRIRSIKNVHAVKWDPAAQEFDKADANWCIVVSELDRKGFEEAYPEAGSAGWAKAQTGQRKLDGWHTGGADRVTVAEEWEVQREPYTRYRVAHTVEGFRLDPATGIPQLLEPTGEEEIIDADKDGLIDGMPAKEFIAGVEAEGWQVVGTRTAYRKKICMYLWGGSKQLAGPIEWKGNRIPVFTVPGRQTHVGGETIHAGIIRHSRDAQRLHNWARATDLEAVSLSAKASPIVPDDAIEGYEDEWILAQRQPVPYRRYKAKPNMPAPKDGEPINSNPGPNSLAQAGVQDMEDTSGVNAAAQGKRSNETSGKAIEAREAQTDVGSFVFIFNLRLIVESIGRELVAAIPHYYSTRKQIMILGQDDAPAIVELSNIKLDLGKYHVLAKTGPAYATKREQSAERLIELLKVAEPWMRAPLIMRALPMLDMPDAEETIAELRAVGEMIGALPPPQAPPGMPGMPPGMPGAPPMPGQGPMPNNVIPMPPRGAPQGADPLAGVSVPVSPRSAPAAPARVGDGRMSAAQPGM